MRISLIPVDTGRKLNVHKTSWTSSERLMCVQFTSCVYWDWCVLTGIAFMVSVELYACMHCMLIQCLYAESAHENKN